VQTLGSTNINGGGCNCISEGYDPITLLCCIWDRHAPRFADYIKCRLWIKSRANERACGDERRTTDPGSTMHGDSLAFTDPRSHDFRKSHRLVQSFGHTAIWNRKRNEFHSLGSAEICFSAKAEFANFLWCQEAYDNIDTLRPPSRDLVVEPVAGAGEP
jgi:hypothetical protein